MELVKKVAEEFLEVDLSAATPQTPLRSLGMDSADQLELVSILEDQLDTSVPDGKFMELETVGDLIAAFAEGQAAQAAQDGSTPSGGDGEGRLPDASR